MALKALPDDVRSILCASGQINNYKTAVAELVYNSLDAESTSIAIRVHIQDNTIQVIDNGYGITKYDFNAIGQRYMTSKLIDISTLKSMPKCYGYRGEFLVNIIEISRNVKIISRHKDVEETWAKTFDKGKKKQFTKMTTRPSKGTTVEIRGFLYNLNIQKRVIDPVNELQNIKAFLEQLSIAHNSISLSLRDDSKNEIIFKIHKKRDIYQTLSILFSIGKNIVQELQVEKNEYKVKAFIGKTDVDIGRHWIYLNGRYVHDNTKLHKVINENLKKYLLIKYRKISKSKNNNNEDDLFKQNIPFYFIFITCPYIDYHISSTRKQTVLEFKNWEQIKIMLEKLIKFYVGDISVKDKSKDEKKVTEEQSKDHGHNNGTHDKIKNIINKILGSNTKKLGVSQIQNGVKGKLVNRKNRKKNKVRKNVANEILLEKDRFVYGQTQHTQLTNSSPNNSTHNNDVINKPETIPEKDTSLLICNQEKSTKKSNESIQYRHSANSHKDNLNMHNFNNIEGNPAIHKNKNVSKAMEESLVKTNFINNIKTSKFKKNKKKKQNISDVKNKKKIIKNRYCQIKSKNNCDYGNNNTQCFGKPYAGPRIRKIVARKEEVYKPPKKYTGRKKDNIDPGNMLARNHDSSEEFNAPQKAACKDIINYVRPKINPFKTTYDLVQTVLESQPVRRFYQIDYSSEVHFRDYRSVHRKPQTISRNTYRTPLKPELLKNNTISGYTHIDGRDEQEHSIMSENLVYRRLTDSSRYNSTHFNGICTYNTIGSSKPAEREQQSLRCQDIFQENSDLLCTQNVTSRYSLNIPTYDSHKYNQYAFGYTEMKTSEGICRYVNKTHSTRFITKQSRDNFTSADKYKSLYKSHLKGKNVNQSNKRINYYCKDIMQKIDESSYTIEFTKSNEINCSIKYSQILVSNQYNFKMCYINDKTQNLYKSHAINNELTTSFGNTYTIPTYSPTSGCKVYYPANQTKCTNSNELFVTSSVYHSTTEKQNCNSMNINREDATETNQDEGNIIFISKPQSNEKERILDDDFQPMEICETVLSRNETIEDEYHSHFDVNDRLDGSLKNYVEDSENNYEDFVKYYTQVIKRHTNNEDVSHHFSNTLCSKDLNMIDDIEADLQRSAVNTDLKENNNVHVKSIQNDIAERNGTEENTFNINHNHFNFKDRLRFLPKGMSQIFETCGSKAICDYNLDTDYYEDVMYNDFANDVQLQAEIYEPGIQNAEEYTTKDIHKFENKILKLNTSLVFDENSLKGAKVLNQIDCKFIAAIIKEKHRESKDSSEYLVLFDQHAVHERIKLEQNLADYFIANSWKTVPVDDIRLKMTKNEILYLHNYKDKFNQLGLQWTILDNDEVSISCIPEAILGKNAREVEKVMKAVKNLIVEQIGVIKLQKGCISLYPKSIMDLVFSEACRYAIKFGDKLTKSNCIDLLNALSNCKTPFQCAHGRPVMAVLVDYKSGTRDYKVDKASLRCFNLNNKTVKT